MKQVLLCLLLCLVITGCTDHSKKSYIEINYEEYKQKIENKEDFALYIGSTNCSHCQDFKPTLEKVINDYDLEIFYVDLSKLDQEQYNHIWDWSAIEGTPEIIFIEKGNPKLFGRVEGAVSEVTLVNKLKSVGYIE